MRDSHSKAVLIVAILGAFVTGVEFGSSADSWSEKGAQKKKRAHVCGNGVHNAGLPSLDDWRLLTGFECK